MLIRQSFIFAALMLAGSAHAATLEFVTPDGIVGPNDTIDIWVRLTADVDFNFDASDPDGDGTYGGLNPDDIPIGGFSSAANGGDGGFVEFDSILDVTTTHGFSCSGSFLGDDGSACAPGANYGFSFASGPDAFSFQSAYSLAAGGSEDFLLGSFIPIAGGAAAGTYDFFTATFFILFHGEGIDDFGELQTANGLLDIASTCSNGDTSCDFTRTVVTAVPVPAAAWLFGSALLGMLVIRRRQPLA